MSPDTGLLREPVELAARKLALALLERAEKRAQRLAERRSNAAATPTDAQQNGEQAQEGTSERAPDSAPDSESLHSFRVALRRLLTHLGAYRPYLDRRVGGKIRKRLKATMDRTSGDRDGEVHRAWLAQRSARRKLPQLERAGLELLAAQLEPSPEESDSYSAVLEAFDRAAATLRRRLQVGSQAVELDAKGRPRSFGSAVRDLLRTHGATLEAQLSAVTSSADEDAAHRARLTVKKMRYLLEPLGRDIPETGSLVRDLKRLQDLLGSHHDLHTLEPHCRRALRRAVRRWRRALERDAAAGVTLATLSATTPELREVYGAAALLRRLHLEQEALYRRLDSGWHGDGATAFFGRLDAVAESLLAGGTGS